MRGSPLATSQTLGHGSLRRPARGWRWRHCQWQRGQCQCEPQTSSSESGQLPEHPIGLGRRDDSDAGIGHTARALPTAVADLPGLSQGIEAPGSQSGPQQLACYFMNIVAPAPVMAQHRVVAGQLPARSKLLPAVTFTVNAEPDTLQRSSGYSQAGLVVAPTGTRGCETCPQTEA